MFVVWKKFWEIIVYVYLDQHNFSESVYTVMVRRMKNLTGRRSRQRPETAYRMAARIQLVLQIDQGNLDGMRGLASTDAAYIA